MNDKQRRRRRRPPGGSARGRAEPAPVPAADPVAGRRGAGGWGPGVRGGAAEPGEDAAAAHTAAVADLAPMMSDPEPERNLRGLVGAGSSQVRVSAAMRARDAARPTAADFAAAEADLQIIRRGWVPRD